MKYCPECGTEYDEEVIQFCTKDGTPLLEKDEPRFTAMPSENSEDMGEDTVIRRRDEPAGATQTDRGERIVIPATPVETPRAQQVRTRSGQAYYAPPPRQNTGKVVALTILGTVAAIGFGALLFWALSRGGQTSNINVNTNPPNINTMNTNGFDSNFNFNGNVSLPPVNFNSTIPNINANLKTPTPKPSPSVSPTASVVPTVTPERTPRPTPSGSPRVSPTPTPRTGPRPPGNLSGQ
ncbi:MAG TPA: hypothetical protein VGI80_03190 [Pyrinomonadaceae bacterium]|jgi:hypothetical protein